MVQFVLHLEQVVLHVGTVPQPLQLRGGQLALVPPGLLVAAARRVALGEPFVRLADRRRMHELLGAVYGALQRRDRGVVGAAGRRQHRHAPPVMDLVVAAGIAVANVFRHRRTARRIVVAGMLRVGLRRDRAMVVLRRRAPPAAEPRSGRRLARVQGRAGRARAAIRRAGSGGKLGRRVAEMRQQPKGVLGELARGLVIADGHQRGGQIGHDCRQLWRRCHRAQHFQSVVQMPDRLVDPVGAVVRGAQ